MPSHYLNQCCNIVNSKLRNTLQWNHKPNPYIFIQVNTFENVVCEMAAILSRPQCVIKSHNSTKFGWADCNGPQPTMLSTEKHRFYHYTPTIWLCGVNYENVVLTKKQIAWTRLLPSLTWLMLNPINTLRPSDAIWCQICWSAFASGIVACRCSSLFKPMLTCCQIHSGTNMKIQWNLNQNKNIFIRVVNLTCYHTVGKRLHLYWIVCWM